MLLVMCEFMTNPCNAISDPVGHEFVYFHMKNRSFITLYLVYIIEINECRFRIMSENNF